MKYQHGRLAGEGGVQAPDLVLTAPATGPGRVADNATDPGKAHSTEIDPVTIQQCRGGTEIAEVMG